MIPPTEHHEACRLATWLRAKGLFFCHVLNEGRKSIRRRAQEKRMGVLAGMPDYLIFTPPPNGRASGTAVELKRQDGKRPTRKQLETLERLRGVGWVVCVAHGADEAIEQLKAIGY
jgi:hypothetical protein